MSALRAGARPRRLQSPRQPEVAREAPSRSRLGYSNPFHWPEQSPYTPAGLRRATAGYAVVFEQFRIPVSYASLRTQAGNESQFHFTSNRSRAARAHLCALFVFV